MDGTQPHVDLIWPDADSFVPELTPEAPSTAQGPNGVTDWTSPDWFACLSSDAGSLSAPVHTLLSGLPTTDAHPSQSLVQTMSSDTGVRATGDKKHANREHQRRFRERQKVRCLA